MHHKPRSTNRFTHQHSPNTARDTRSRPRRPKTLKGDTGAYLQHKRQRARAVGAGHRHVQRRREVGAREQQWRATDAGHGRRDVDAIQLRRALRQDGDRHRRVAVHSQGLDRGNRNDVRAR